MNPRICVVTPSFQHGRFIERTIRSVITQRVPDLEYFVADGGSTDETLAILRYYSSQLRYISEKDRGQTHALNKGITATTAPIIGWLNSDDVYFPGALRIVLDFFSTHPDIDVLYGRAVHIDEFDHFIENYPTDRWNFERLKETCFICQPAAFFRRRVIDRYGLPDESLQYCMDYEYWLRLGRMGARFEFFDYVLAGSRFYAQNKTLAQRVRVHAEINDVMRRTFGQVPERWIYNYAHAVADERGLARGTRDYILSLVGETWKAAARWGHPRSRSLLRTTRSWLLQAWRGEGPG
jgi:glycosyltransferase involved in cell wall biosynthesis